VEFRGDLPRDEPDADQGCVDDGGEEQRRGHVLAGCHEELAAAVLASALDGVRLQPFWLFEEQ
jgi:hypothetical protein